uniref:Uncharacterized protein n=1 Tax=Siphoviridae sp. ctnPP24 TaxID=2825662 RepID=A0A8S5TZ75_9CAUD|nr:MAG TPA: hypothetical protein [Siphoviridae sp. ctnPP24]
MTCIPSAPTQMMDSWTCVARATPKLALTTTKTVSSSYQ